MSNKSKLSKFWYQPMIAEGRRISSCRLTPSFIKTFKKKTILLFLIGIPDHQTSTPVVSFLWIFINFIVWPTLDQVSLVEFLFSCWPSNSKYVLTFFLSVCRLVCCPQVFWLYPNFAFNLLFVYTLTATFICSVEHVERRSRRIHIILVPTFNF